MDGGYVVILVDSTSQTIKLEKLFIHNHICCKLIPVPRHLSSDCGVCIRINGDDRLTALGLIKEYKISIQSIEEV